MIKSITISIKTNESKMQHTVSTKEEALALIDRYFDKPTISKVKIGDKVRVLSDGGFTNGMEYIGYIYKVEALYGNGKVGLRTGMPGQSDLWVYCPEDYELVKE
ncbi:hypothetical protein [Enterococcus casseliflavus]|uniref:hypothetical protein n=1 Tax=Enterococcus casseliflavus TaxID=37734 RepID=UPI00288F22F8|nr:hypothetical protein [Enterococcus casseliflavus]MDT2961619.1 hypothetical protein [Enterococcus casseliflavus]